MQNIIQSPKKPPDGGNESMAKEPMSTASAERRLVLLKGLGRGAAALAATVPIQTLAGQSVLTPDGKHQCSVSGMHSGVHSATTTTTVCGGYSPGWWGQSTDGGISPSRTWGSANYNAAVTTVCSWSALMTTATSTVPARSPTLFEVMSPKAPLGHFPDSDEFHWICAWLNALGGYFNFPYSAQEVLDFAALKYSDPTKYQDALTFFKTYMETHTS
jgi:hypothetical protein